MAPWVKGPASSCSCYFFAVGSGDKAGFDGAQEQCRDLSGHLVVIETAEENDWLISQLVDDIWIGLSAQSGDWLWVDGKPFTGFSGFGPAGIPLVPAALDFSCVNLDGPVWLIENNGCVETDRFVCEQ